MSSPYLHHELTYVIYQNEFDKFSRGYFKSYPHTKDDMKKDHPHSSMHNECMESNVMPKNSRPMIDGKASKPHIICL